MPAIGGAVAGQQRELLAVDALTEFVKQPRFADAGLTDDVDHMHAAQRVLSATVQAGQLLVSPHEGRKTAPHGRAEAGRSVGNPIEPEDPLRFALSFDAVLTKKVSGDQSLDQPVGGIAQQDGAGLGQVLEARGQIDGVADRGNARLAPRANPANDCWARIDANPQLRSKAEARFYCGHGIGQTLLDQ